MARLSFWKCSSTTHSLSQSRRLRHVSRQPSSFPPWIPIDWGAENLYSLNRITLDITDKMNSAISKKPLIVYANLRIYHRLGVLCSPLTEGSSLKGLSPVLIPSTSLLITVLHMLMVKNYWTLLRSLKIGKYSQTTPCKAVRANDSYSDFRTVQSKAKIVHSCLQSGTTIPLRNTLLTTLKNTLTRLNDLNG